MIDALNSPAFYLFRFPAERITVPGPDSDIPAWPNRINAEFINNRMLCLSMAFDIMAVDLDIVAFFILSLCIGIVAIVHQMAGERKKNLTVKESRREDFERYGHLFKHTAHLDEVEQFESSKSLRKAYRKNWTEKILAQRAYPEAREIIRNLIMTNAAFLSAVLISFGLLLSGFSVLEKAGGVYPELKVISISALLIYSLFMLISQARILNYVPIVLWVDEEIIKKKQGEEKSAYISKLMDDSFDHFSDSLRAVFFAVICIFWFFNTPIFIGAILIMTAIIVKSDTDKTLRVSIF